MIRNTIKITLTFILALNYTAATANDAYSGPDFTAKKVTVDGSDKTVSQIHMSKKGFREEILTNVRQKIIYISNYKDKIAWMIIPAKKIYSNMESMPGAMKGDFARSTLFDGKPCRGFNKTKRLAIKQIAKQKIEEWGCINHNKKQAILQWYNPGTKMVIREQDKVTNSSDIRVSHFSFKSQPDKLFSVPRGYKEIKMTEMLNIMNQ